MNVGKITALDSMNCNDNKLASLDVSNNNQLKGLACTGNLLACIKVSQSQLNRISEDWYKDEYATWSLDCN